MKTIDMTPSWATIVVMCCEVIGNPNADREAKDSCRDELLRLAKIVDKQNEEARKPPVPLGQLIDEMRENQTEIPQLNRVVLAGFEEK